MARTKTRELRIDATRPLCAVVGAGDLVVEYARHTATDVQTRFAKVELEPKALRKTARKVVVTRVDELQNEAKALPGRAQALVGGYVADLNETFSGTVSELNDTYADLATRGKTLVTRIRRQQATQDAKAAAGTTKAKAKTATTQVKKSASTTKSAAKKTAKTARSNAKTTTTSARKAASSTAKATAKGAEKVGD